MTYHRHYWVLAGIFILGIILGAVLLHPVVVDNLFSKALNVVIEEEVGSDPQPVVVSLDWNDTQELSLENQQLQVDTLKQELLETTNDPEKAMELRRRIQRLQEQVQNQNQASVTIENSL